MAQRQRWQRGGLSPLIRNLIIGGIALAALIVIFIGGYEWGWTWVGVASVPTKTGFTAGKTFYDFLTAFGIPALIVGFIKTYLDGSDQKRIASDYRNAIADLMTDLRPDPVTKKRIAKAQTTTTFPLLNRRHKENLRDFLQTSGFVSDREPSLDITEGAKREPDARPETHDAAFISQQELEDLLRKGSWL